MKTVFTSELKPLLDALARDVNLYVPAQNGDHYVFAPYDPKGPPGNHFNNIRACTPVKEFLFPLRELAAVFPEPAEPEDIAEFCVFALKDCDLRSLDILDKVFLEDEFKDSLYSARRDKMFVVASDCSDPGESCFCNAMDGRGFPESGFDLNLSKIKDGFIVQAGSTRGQAFLERHAQIFATAPDTLLAQRDVARARTADQLTSNNKALGFDVSIHQAVAAASDSEVFDDEAADCVECQGCTRICPTCHCFYLYDTTRQDYFGKMKMWDSCMRFSYAEVAGGDNPRKMLGDRLRHRMMHKFSYFLDRYGVNMCVGCGRCIDGEAGRVDIRVVLKRLSEEFKVPKKTKAAK